MEPIKRIFWGVVIGFTLLFFLAFAFDMGWRW